MLLFQVMIDWLIDYKNHTFALNQLSRFHCSDLEIIIKFLDYVPLPSNDWLIDYKNHTFALNHLSRFHCSDLEIIITFPPNKCPVPIGLISWYKGLRLISCVTVHNRASKLSQGYRGQSVPVSGWIRPLCVILAPLACG